MYLCNIWQQVVGDTLRVFSNQARGMSSNWVEITQQHSIPALLTQMRHNQTSRVCVCASVNAFVSPYYYFLSFALVLDHLLDEELGFAIGVGAAAHRVLFIYGKVLRVAVHCGGAAEDQILHLVCLHNLGQMQIQTKINHIWLAGGETAI